MKQLAATTMMTGCDLRMCVRGCVVGCCCCVVLFLACLFGLSFIVLCVWCGHVALLLGLLLSFGSR